MRKFILAAALMLTAAPAFAHGSFSCNSGDPKGWQSIATLEAKLVKEGWTVKKSHPHKGCYEVYGTTPEGDRVEAFFDPVTLEKQLVNRRGEVVFKKAE